MIRRLLLVLFLCGPILVGPLGATPAAAKDLLGTAADAGTFTIFLAGVKSAGLSEFLGGEGPITLFAPTDDAFAKLPRGSVDTLLLPENRDRLRTILMRHVVIGKVTARDFLGRRMEAATAGGALILIDATKTAMIGPARLIRGDIPADNGLIHVIDTVLMP
jgi:uncharacterized surface protein with fasciclin (FAS1) repeats